MKLAAIDIGSNAARLLIVEVLESPLNGIQFNKLNLIRIPLRLGFDVFETGRIGKERQEKLIKTIKAFSMLMDIYEVEAFKACATSAMRDAENKKDMIEVVKLETGITIELLSGDKEAFLINQNHVAEKLDKQHDYLYIDVGGGSTEVTFFKEGHMRYRHSFNIGSIRLLKNMVTELDWNKMEQTLKENIQSTLPIHAIGSGGNINKIFSLSKKKDGKPLTLNLLKDYYKELSNQPIDLLIKNYKLKADRADVIVPALSVYINIMRWLGIEEIYVPKIGLADGLISELYESKKTKVTTQRKTLTLT